MTHSDVESRAIQTLRKIRILVESRKQYNQFDGPRSIGVTELENILNEGSEW